MRPGHLEPSMMTSLINFSSFSVSPPLARGRGRWSGGFSVITAYLPLSGAPTTTSLHGQFLTDPCSIGVLAVPWQRAFTTNVISPLPMRSAVLWAMLGLPRRLTAYSIYRYVVLIWTRLHDGIGGFIVNFTWGVDCTFINGQYSFTRISVHF